MPEPTTPQPLLSESDIEQLEMRTARSGYYDAAGFIPLTQFELDALIRDWRAMKTENEWQKSSIECFTVAVAGCAERLAAKQQQQYEAGFEAGTAFAKSVIEDRETENAALREQLAGYEPCVTCVACGRPNMAPKGRRIAMTTNSLNTDEREGRLSKAALTKHSLRALINGGNVDELERRINSLLDSEAAGGERDVEWALHELADGWITNNEREGPHGFNQNARRVLTFIADDAATAMRDLCVEKVKALREQWLARLPNSDDETFKYHYRTRSNAAQEIVTALESLTLNEEQE